MPSHSTFPMSPADRRRVVLLAAEVGERYLGLLDARAKHNPHHDSRGRFARTGGGPHPRAHQAPRKVRGPEHAEYLGHQAQGRREHARDVRRERRQLGREHAAEEGALRRQSRRQAANLDRRQGRESARLDARHGRETAKAPDSRTLVRRHAEERADLIATHLQERHDLAGEIRSERRDLRDEHREAVRDRRREHLEGIRDFRRGQRSDMAETLRDIRSQRQYERESREDSGKSWRGILDTKGRDSPVPSPDDLLDEALDNLGLADAYRDDSLTPRRRLDLLHEIRLVCKAWFRREADTVLAEAAPADDGTTKALGGAVRFAVGSFFGKARGFLRSAIVAGTLALLGPEPLDDATLAGVERNVAVQVAYLDDFEAEVTSGSGPLDGTFASRAEMYGAAAWGSAHDVLRAQAVDVFAEERRIHVGGDDPCHVCAAQQALGWQPIGTLRPIGESPCLTHCHCHFVYRDRDGAEYIAGRGPLDAAASGATG